VWAGEVVVQAQSFPHVTPIGIDGDPSLKEVWQSHYPVSPEFFCHDFAEGPPPVGIEFSFPGPVAERVVVWSVEFVEHVEERYIPNYLPVFADADVVVMTHSEDPRGHPTSTASRRATGGGVMAAAGLRLDEECTAHIRAISTMTREFMRKPDRCTGRWGRMEDREYREWAREVLLHWGEDVVYPTIPRARELKLLRRSYSFFRAPSPGVTVPTGQRLGVLPQRSLCRGWGYQLRKP
jgi:hypothetical protein